jgi:hypothetical protein
MFQLLAQGLPDVIVQVSSGTLSDMIPCTGWPHSYQEHNGLIPQLHEDNNQLGCVACYYRAHGVTAIMLS